MTQGTTPPGWYDDGQGAQRWWDGSQWTDHTQPAPGADDRDGGTGTAAGAGGTGGTGSADSSTVDPHAEVTRVTSSHPSPGPASHPAPVVGLDKQSDDVTRVAPASGYAPGQHQPGQQAPAYGQQQPAYGQPGPGQPGPPAWQQGGGAPGQPAWQQPYSSGSSGGGKGKLFAIIGGAVALLIIAVVLLLVLLGGGGPEGVAEDYVEAQTELDFERVCELTAEEQQKEILEGTESDDCGGLADVFEDEFTSEIRGYVDDIEFDIEIDDVKEDGDKATVDYTVTSEYTGDDPDGFRDFTGEDALEDEESDSLELVREDGDWKVAETFS